MLCRVVLDTSLFDIMSGDVCHIVAFVGKLKTN